MHTPHTQKKSHSFFGLLSVFVALVVLGVTSYYWFDSYRLENLQEKLQERIDKKESTRREQSDGLEFNQFLNASQALKKAEQYRVPWSQIAQNIMQFETPNIVFESFSATPEKTTSIQGIASDIENIRGLLSTLKNQSNIINPFVSSLTKSKDDTGRTIFTFQLTFDFQSL